MALTLAISGVSYPLSPSACQDWFAFRLRSAGSSVLLPLLFATIMAIVLLEAPSSPRRTVARGAWTSRPIIWINPWVVLPGCIRPVHMSEARAA